jgi:hypothetical protein
LVEYGTGNISPVGLTERLDNTLCRIKWGLAMSKVGEKINVFTCGK